MSIIVFLFLSVKQKIEYRNWFYKNNNECYQTTFKYVASMEVQESLIKSKNILQ